MNFPIIANTVIQQFISGDETAFNLVYKTYCGKVYQLAYRFLKDKEQSEEVVQEVFINLWLNKKRLSIDGNIWLYIYVITKNLSLNSLRKLSKSSNFLERLLSQMNPIQNNTEEDIFAHSLEEFTNELIEKLPPQQQLVFKLSRNKGLSHKQIAEQLNISQHTVKNHLVVALKTLKSHLKFSDLFYGFVLFFGIKFIIGLVL